ncbi:hypothetical protein SynBIOSU31_00124 [Synechococcus sp. BIOS-U3-1]|nr:hypothetical protein SynBIOSU31_00124 [Synechococcus sp. BIOS-U3-1]
MTIPWLVRVHVPIAASALISGVSSVTRIFHVPSPPRCGRSTAACRAQGWTSGTAQS